MRHPAMLLYPEQCQQCRRASMRNYARELLELHTMGVGSGCARPMLQAMARVLTGVGFSTREDRRSRRPKLRPERQGRPFSASSEIQPQSPTTRPRSCSLAGRWKKRTGPGQRGGRPHGGVAVTARFASTQALRLFSCQRQTAPTRGRGARPRPSAQPWRYLPPRWRPC